MIELAGESEKNCEIYCEIGCTFKKKRVWLNKKDMVMSYEDVVLVEENKVCGEPTVVTVNCPDKAGLGCDLVRNVLEFGLYVTRGG